MLVLDGAPLDRTATGALWAAFAGGGRHRAAVGRLVVVPSVAEPLIAAVVAAAQRLRPGDPRRPETEVGPLRSPETRARVEELVAEAVADGATLLCGGPLDVAGVRGRVLRPRGAARRAAGRAAAARAACPARCWPSSRRRREEDAIALATGAPAVSVWSGDRARGERVARTLGAEVAWVNEHGHSIPGAAVRLAGHVDGRRLASQPTRLRSARWLPYDPALVRASTATARLQHGRENERLGVLRSGAVRSPAPRCGSRARRWGARRRWTPARRPTQRRLRARGSGAGARAAAGRRRA